jgi:hypothetical protein
MENVLPYLAVKKCCTPNLKNAFLKKLGFSTFFTWEQVTVKGVQPKRVCKFIDL